VPWPDRHSTDPSAEVARQFVLNLHDAMGGRTLRDVAAQVGIHHVTLLKILHGRAWPDLATVSRLEIGLNADLYSSADVRAELERAASTPAEERSPRARSE
jgi:transcriptional regulator with XRE-family HTH domain